MKNVFKRFTSMILSTVLLFNIFAPLTVNALPASTTTDIYVVWDCDDEVCVSDAITVNNGVEGAGGVMNYETNYIKASEVVDSAKNKTLDPSKVTAADKSISGITEWYIYESLPAGIKDKTWEELDIAIHEEDYDKGIDPTGGNDGFNSLVHNGDRKYRVVIYDDTKYESLTFNVDPDNYTYYLGAWDPVFANPTIDISGSTVEL